MFPVQRARRLRKNSRIRELVRETSVEKSDLMYPMFIADIPHREIAVDSMPGVAQFNIDGGLNEASALYERGIRYFLIFGIPKTKDANANSAFAENGIVQQFLQRIRQEIPEAVLFTDVCLCAYTDHGHCGIVKNGRIDNDASVEILARTALSHARAGADFVAPSDMMDGRVLAIRQTLDESGLTDIGILAYSAKYASSFYGPFRDAAHSAPQFGDRRSHQMDAANRREALKEIQADIDEGADIIMVKPALSYLDIISDAKQHFLLPVAAYNVSGEYSLIKAADQKGWVDGRAIRDEVLLSIKRAGADIIITYFAKEIAFEE